MSDDGLIRDLKSIDRFVIVDPAFAERLFVHLRDERRPRARRLPLVLLAAALLIGASVAAVVVGGGGPSPSEDAVPVTQTWTIPLTSGALRIEYAVPSDFDLIVSEGETYLAFTAGGDGAYTLDGRTERIPPGARGVKITDVAGATAHYSNDRPMGTGAGSFLSGLATHPILDVEVGEIAEASLGSTPALSADLRSKDLEKRLENGTQAHLDKGDVSIDLWPPSRLIVADVGGAIVLVQIWAGSEEELAAWLPKAERLVASFRLGAEG